MIALLVLASVPALPAAPSAHLPTAVPLTRPLAQDGDYDAKLAAAGDDVSKLWELHLWCRENSKYKESRDVLTRIVELEPDHEEARKALGHRFYDGQWFESYSKLSAYKREEEKRMLDEKGLVRFKESWVPQADVPFLRMGWEKDEKGRWLSPREREAMAREAAYVEEGWQQQDLTWVHPDDFDKWREGLWKCGDEWLTVEKANEYHSRINQWWQFPAEHFVVHSTCDRGSTEWAGYWADQTYADLVRAYGLQPDDKPVVVVLNGIAQYNRLAAGDQAAGIPTTEVSGHSSCHYAYFAESWVDQSKTPAEYLGCGVTYWDRGDENLAPYGQHAIRNAAGLSYAEAIDPSWDTVSRAVEAPTQAFNADAFWREKRIPRWLRYGVASYVERYFQDKTVEDGNDPWWARSWALANLKAQGGLRPIEELFAFRLDPADQSGKIMSEAGLLVSFVLDGECAPVVRAHAAFKAALRSGESTEAAVEALQKAILDNAEALHAYAGF